jgi:hypothetical protein
VGPFPHFFNSFIRIANQSSLPGTNCSICACHGFASFDVQGFPHRLPPGKKPSQLAPEAEISA